MTSVSGGCTVTGIPDVSPAAHMTTMTMIAAVIARIDIILILFTFLDCCRFSVSIGRTRLHAITILRSLVSCRRQATGHAAPLRRMRVCLVDCFQRGGELPAAGAG